MDTFIREVRQTLAPDATSPHGPLTPLLLVMTFVTGLVDAFSYLVLGHVFVANMTGNIVFLGFALAGAPDFSILDSFVALVSFGFGAAVGGRLGSQLGHHRGKHLSTAATIQAVFLGAAVVVAVASGSAIAGEYHDVLIIVLGMSMGIQNASARKLGVPDMTTTVLTLTITGIGADSTLVGGKGSLAGRRFVAIAAMLAGALVGAALIVHLNIIYPLVIALVLVLFVAVATRLLSASDAVWVHARS
jgi:uncharacterized membrane protein YoaK (UPF0700 family)